jgi:osmotically-inducible protein OsmY
MKREIIFVLVLVCAGCAQQDAKKDTQPALRALGQSVTAEEARSDEDIGFEIRNRLNRAGPGETSGVIVEVSDGIVTLSGTAPTLAAAWRAEAAVHDVKGTKKVYNKIIVPNAGP